jgi:hypothetical protein
MLTDHDITKELAAAFHDRADPVSGTTVDPAGIFPRGMRARRRHTAVRAAAASIGAALVAVVLAVNLSAGPESVVAEPPPGLLLAAAVLSPPPPAPRSRVCRGTTSRWTMSARSPGPRL